MSRISAARQRAAKVIRPETFLIFENKKGTSRGAFCVLDLPPRAL